MELELEGFSTAKDVLTKKYNLLKIKKKGDLQDEPRFRRSV